MHVRGIAFDVNGTLVQIRTEDGSDQIFRAAGHFLTYQGIDLRRNQVRDEYFEIMKRQQKSSDEAHPEYDAPGIWREIIDRHATDFTHGLPAEKRAQMPLFLAEMGRGISRRRCRLYPHVRHVLNTLRGHVRLSLVTDAQSAYARGELHKVGLLDFFDPIVVSGDHGFRKPDPRLFQIALDGMGTAAHETLYVGNDMYRDVYGARECGLGTVLFESDQGTKVHGDCVPDHRITDHRALLGILGL